MRAKENLMKSPYFTKEELDSLFPICDASHSDSRNLDSMVELLVMSGRSLPHAMMMVIPEAWQGNHLMDEKRKAFYEYHATMMEPWDGPASVCFTDGKIVGATLDRNGLRPSRYTLTRDDRLVMASEAGALPVKPYNVKEKGRLQPGKIFVVDLEQGRIISDEELKASICEEFPYEEWLNEHKTNLNRFTHMRTHPSGKRITPHSKTTTLWHQQRGAESSAWPHGSIGKRTGRFNGLRHATGHSISKESTYFSLFQTAFRAG